MPRTREIAATMTLLHGAMTRATCWPDGPRPSGEWQAPRIGPDSQSPTSKLAMLAQSRMPALRSQPSQSSLVDAPHGIEHTDGDEEAGRVRVEALVDAEADRDAERGRERIERGEDDLAETVTGNEGDARAEAGALEHLVEEDREEERDERVVALRTERDADHCGVSVVREGLTH